VGYSCFVLPKVHFYLNIREHLFSVHLNRRCKSLSSSVDREKRNQEMWSNLSKIMLEFTGINRNGILVYWERGSYLARHVAFHWKWNTSQFTCSGWLWEGAAFKWCI